jgi:hypothetical protein
MHYAHLRGVVHRDLKPGNVLLTGAERLPKITDFGLAKRIDAEAREVSQSGAIMGTASYMAPEQAAGKVRDTGPAADVYALGALLYECLTGQAPFEGPQHAVLVRVVADEPVPPSRRAAKVPRDLETICLKCLSKEPARRYASAEELANDLRRFQANEPIRARPAGRLERAAKWARRRPALAVLLVVTVLGVAGIVWKYLDAEGQKGIAQEQAARAERATDYLVGIFELADTKGRRGTMTARQILDDAERNLPQEFADPTRAARETAGEDRDRLRQVDRRGSPRHDPGGARHGAVAIDPGPRPMGASPDAAPFRGPAVPGGGRRCPTRCPVRPAPGTTATGNGGYDPPQRLRTDRRRRRTEPGHFDDLRAPAQGDFFHGLGW